MKVSEMYCSKDGDNYRNFYVSHHAVKAATDRIPIKVRIIEDNNGKYYGWWDNKEERFTLVFPSRIQVIVCFPYSIETHESAREGKLLQVDIEEVE